MLGIRLVHSRPYAPQGRGKQERLNRVIRERFLLEAEQAGIASLDGLNDRFMAWVGRWLNVRLHSETGETPIARFSKGRVVRPSPELLRRAFQWSAQRRVSRTATVSFAGNEALCRKPHRYSYAAPANMRRHHESTASRPLG